MAATKEDTDVREDQAWGCVLVAAFWLLAALILLMALKSHWGP